MPVSLSHQLYTLVSHTVKEAERLASEVVKAVVQCLVVRRLQTMPPKQARAPPRRPTRVTSLSYTYPGRVCVYMCVLSDIVPCMVCCLQTLLFRDPIWVEVQDGMHRNGRDFRKVREGRPLPSDRHDSEAYSWCPAKCTSH